jgi:ribosome biogenesis GTPase A
VNHIHFEFKDRSKMNKWLQLKRLIHRADVIVEVVDARDIAGTRIPIAEKWIGTQRLLMLANKADLLTGGISPVLPKKAILTSAKTTDEKARRQLISVFLSKTTTRPVKALFIGYPNVGKSSLINMLAGKKIARVSPIAGTTKNVQWINITSELLSTDYRGVFPEQQAKVDLIRKGAVNIQGSESKYVHNFAMDILKNRTLRKWLETKFDIDLSKARGSEEVLAAMAERRKWYVKGGKLNLEEAGRALIRAMKEAPEI